MNVVKVLSPTGMLGYGYPLTSLQEGFAKQPDVIAVDAGSTDAGPHKLGEGVGIVSRYATKRDLIHLIKGAIDLEIPLLIGSAGGCGADITLSWTQSIIEEIIQEAGLHTRAAYIHAELDRAVVKKALHSGKIHSFESSPLINDSTIDTALRIVAQMGVEPFHEALRKGAKIIVAGRSYDPCMAAALPLLMGFPKGLAWHAAKILECGAQCAVPGDPSDCVLGYIFEDRFVIEPLNPLRRCTPLSVASHALYEKPHPYLLAGPGGRLDLSDCRYDLIDDHCVAVYGSRFLPGDAYQIKLEGATRVAYRTICIAGARDPILIDVIDEVLDRVSQQVSANFEDIPEKSYQVFFHVYGRNGVMGDLEPIKRIRSHELGIVIDVVAATQELADSICAYVRSSMMHYHYSGRLATGGNLAFPFSPSDIPFGGVYRFCIYHLMDTDDPLSLFPIEIVDY